MNRPERAAASASGLSRLGYRLVFAITALSVGHHLDHIARDATGWPLDGGFNPFSASLIAYPIIAVGLLLSRRHLVGARVWLALAGGAALFLTVVHVGPVAGDDVQDIPDDYSSPSAGLLALLLLAALVALLAYHTAHEWRRLRRHRRSARDQPLGL